MSDDKPETTLGAGMSDEEQRRISRECNPLTWPPDPMCVTCLGTGLIPRFDGGDHRCPTCQGGVSKIVFKTSRERELVSALIGLRAWVLHMAATVEGIGELPARKRGPEATRLAERMRHAISAPNLVGLCK